MNILSKLTAWGRMAAALMIGGVVLVSSGCREEDPPAISVNQQMFRIGTEAHELSLRVMSNTDWVATYSTDAKYDPIENAGWITLSRESGRGSADLTMFIEPYKGALAEGRQGVITFTTTGSGADIATVIINQGEQNTLLQVIPPEYTIGGEGGKVYFTIVSNTDWEIFGDCDWATLDRTTGAGNTTVGIDVLDWAIYSDDATREIAYQIVAGHSSAVEVAEFLLSQKGKPDPTITLGQEAVNFPAAVDADGITAAIPIITNVTLPSGTTPMVLSADSWVAATVSDIGGIWMIEIDPTDNTSFDSRETIITVIIPSTDAVGGSVMKQIRVTQDGADAPSFEMLGDVYTIASSTSATGGVVSKTIGFIASTGLSVTVREYPDWFTAAPTVSGTNSTVTFIAKPNYEADQRVGTIVLAGEAGGVTIARTVTIIQNGIGQFDLTVTPQTVSLIADAGASGTFNVYVHSSVTMAIKAVIQVDGSWITCPTTFTPIPNTGNATGTTYVLAFTYGSNTDANMRTGTIEIFAEAGSQSKVAAVNVSQGGVGGPNIQILPTSVTLANTSGANQYLAVLNGAGVTITNAITPTGWVTAVMDPTTGTSPTSITLTAGSKNDAVADREAAMFVWATKGGQTQLIEIPIIQPGTAAAELDIANLLYEVSAGGQVISIPVVGLNGSTFSVIGNDYPAGMYAASADEPVEGTDVIGATVAPNTLSSERVSYTYILAENGDSRKIYTLVIKQAGLASIEAVMGTSNIDIAWNTTGTADEKLVINNLPEGTQDTDISLISNVSWLAGGTVTVSGTTATIEVETLGGTPAGVNPFTKDRVANLTITVSRGIESQDLSATVTQLAAPAPIAYLSTDEYRVSADIGGAATIFTLPFYNVNSNTTFGAVETTNASVVSTASVSSLGVLSFTVPGDNADTDEIESTLTIPVIAGGETVLVKLKVIQNGTGSPDISVLPSSVTYGAAIATGALYIDNPNGAEVSLQSAPTWLTGFTTLPTTGANPVITYDVAENTTSTERSGIIVLNATLGGKTVTYSVGVVQQGLNDINATLSRSYVEFDAQYTTAPTEIVQVLNLPSSASITSVTSSAGTGAGAWLTASNSGNNVSISVQNNDTGVSRNGEIYVTVTRGTGATQEVKTLTIAVRQLTQVYDQPNANATPSNMLFEADQASPETKTVTIQSTDVAYIHDVVVPDWLNATAVTATGATATFRVTAAGTNDTTTPLQDVVKIIIRNGDKSQTITIPVVQKPLLAPIVAVGAPVIFPATASGVSAAFPVNFLNYDANIYTINAVATGDWFEIRSVGTEPLVIHPKTAWTGAVARTGTVIVTFTSRTNPAYLTQLTISVSQNAATAPNITYGPAEHTISASGGEIYTFFANPDGLNLSETVYTNDVSFIESTLFDTYNDRFTVTVAPNPSKDERIAHITIVAMDAAENVIGEYPIRIVQAGFIEPVPEPLFVSFDPPSTQFHVAGKAWSTLRATWIVSVKHTPGMVLSDFSIIGGCPTWMEVSYNSDNDGAGGELGIKITVDILDPITLGSYPISGMTKVYELEMKFIDTATSQPHTVYHYIHVHNGDPL